MRKLIVCNIMSLDGYYEGPGKNVMDLFNYRPEAFPADESFDVYNAERLRSADTLLLGRTSYEGFKGYWPSVADDPNATPATREISRLDNAIEKLVISDRLTMEDTDRPPRRRDHKSRAASSQPRMMPGCWHLPKSRNETRNGALTGRLHFSLFTLLRLCS